MWGMFKKKECTGELRTTIKAQKTTEGIWGGEGQRNEFPSGRKTQLKPDEELSSGINNQDTKQSPDLNRMIER